MSECIHRDTFGACVISDKENPCEGCDTEEYDVHSGYMCDQSKQCESREEL